MSRLVSMAALCSLLLGCQAFNSSHPEPVRDSQAISSVHSIYIAELREDDTSNLIERSDVVREAIQEGLARSGRFVIVQNLSEADAVLAGLAGVERWYHGMEGYYGMEGDLDTHELGIGRLRLEDAKTKKVIWTHEYETGFLSPKQTVAERVATQVIDKLMHDASDPAPDLPATHK